MADNEPPAKKSRITLNKAVYYRNLYKENRNVRTLNHIASLLDAVCAKQLASPTAPSENAEMSVFVALRDINSPSIAHVLDGYGFDVKMADRYWCYCSGGAGAGTKTLVETLCTATPACSDSNNREPGLVVSFEQEK